MVERIVIIDTSFGGLAAAVRLATRGFEVKVFEKLDKPVGQAYVIEKNSFVFDGGPTVITAPFLFDELFNITGKRRDDYAEFIAITPFYRIFNP